MLAEVYPQWNLIQVRCKENSVIFEKNSCDLEKYQLARIWAILNKKRCQDLKNNSWDMANWTSVTWTSVTGTNVTKTNVIMTNVRRTNVTWKMVHIHTECSMISSRNFCDYFGVFRFLRWSPSCLCFQNAFLWLVENGLDTKLTLHTYPPTETDPILMNF